MVWAALRSRSLRYLFPVPLAMATARTNGRLVSNCKLSGQRQYSSHSGLRLRSGVSLSRGRRSRLPTGSRSSRRLMCGRLRPRRHRNGSSSRSQLSGSSRRPTGSSSSSRRRSQPSGSSSPPAVAPPGSSKRGRHLQSRRRRILRPGIAPSLHSPPGSSRRRLRPGISQRLRQHSLGVSMQLRSRGSPNQARPQRQRRPLRQQPCQLPWSRPQRVRIHPSSASMTAATCSRMHRRRRLPPPRRSSSGGPPPLLHLLQARPLPGMHRRRRSGVWRQLCPSRVLTVGAGTCPALLRMCRPSHSLLHTALAALPRA